MKKSSKAGRITRAIFSNIVVAVISIVFAVITPVWGLSSNLLSRLTNQETYREIVRDLGLGTLLEGSVSKLGDLLPASVSGYLEGNEAAQGAMKELDGVLAKAVDDAAVNIAAQVPAYVTGQIDHLEGSVNLTEFRNQAVSLAQRHVPGGALLGGIIRKGVEAKVPASIPLDHLLTGLEVVLSPLRAAVSNLTRFVSVAGSFSLLALLWMVLLGFNLARTARWVGLGFAGAGIIGSLTGGLINWLLSFALPDAVLDNQLFQDLLHKAFWDYSGAAMAWLVLGGSLFFLSIIVPIIAGIVGRRIESCPLGPLFSRLTGGSPWTVATLLALFPAVISYPLSRRELVARRAHDAALRGKALAAITLDCLFPVLVLGGLVELGVVGKILTLPFLSLLVLFWLLRDRPKTLGGINFIDRICKVIRGTEPHRNTSWASARRALPLLAAAGLSPFVPPHLPFGGVWIIWAASTLFFAPGGSLFDLLAGTRARLIRA